MDINRGNMDALFTAFNTKLQEGFSSGAQATAILTTLAMIIPSTTGKESHALMQLLSSIHEWVGPRQVNDISSKKLDVSNRDFEHTIGVNRNDIEDDTIGMYSPLFAEIGYDAEYLWMDLFIDALVGNGNWLDGAAFFGTSRKYGSHTIANYVTTALSEATFETAYKTMGAYQFANDKSCRVAPSHLLVGPALADTAWDIVRNKQRRVDGTAADVAIENRNEGKCDLVILPDLVGTYANYWFLGDFRRPVKPVAVQKRKTGALQRWDKDSDPNVKDKNENHYGVHYRGEAFLAVPHRLYAGYKS